MPLVRAFSRVDEEGRIPIPSNVRRMTGFAPGAQVEIRLQGPNQRPTIVLHRQPNSKGRLTTALPGIPVAHH